MDRDMMEWMKPFQKTFDQDFFKCFQHLLDQNNNQPKETLKVNLYEEQNELLCVALLPGIDNVDHISLNVHLNTIEISGTSDIKLDHGRVAQKEFELGEFRRVIQLPYVVREDKVDATYRNGLLMIYLYKLMTNKQNEHKITIKHFDE